MPSSRETVADSTVHYTPSFYNLTVDLDDELLLFNGTTGALLRLPPDIRPEMESLLGPRRPRTAGTGFSGWQPRSFSLAELSERLREKFATFIDAGIFLENDRQERDELAGDYAHDRSRAPLFVTLTTTLDCNMRCYYCYQKEDELNGMSLETCDEIIEWTKSRLENRNHRSLYIDWYGGEPMLNQAVIERFSAAMIPHCERVGVDYKASMICNGTNWPEDRAGFIARNRIRSIQFSIDGPKRNHDKRRGLIKADGVGRTPSFDTVMETVASAIGLTKIYLRINVDPWTGWECMELLDYCAERGWLEEGVRFYPYVALINAMTEHCGFIGKSEKFSDFELKFEEIEQGFYKRLARHRGPGTLEVVQYFPGRVTINCAAVSHNAVVFGPNGLSYKCGLDVGDDHRAHDGIGRSGKAALAARQDPLPADRWDRYDPFSHPRCSECQYLPICMGGCPKAQMDGDTAQIALQSRFWENNFDRIIRRYYLSATGGGGATASATVPA